MPALFELDDFSVSIETSPGQSTPIVEGLSLAVHRGETLCIVGESGSGKSVAMLSAVRLLELTAPISVSGKALLDGVNLMSLSQRQMAGVRGGRIGFIFQEAMEALNPTRTIATQLVEAAVVTHAMGDIPAREARTVAAKRALELLEEVEIRDPETVMNQYPHQLSGGMQQRVMIAMALMGDPDLLIADEPTTALDVTVQAEVLDLMKRLRRERDMSCVLITHDMGVASEIADRIAVLYAGQLVELGSFQQMISRPQHAYTKALLECVPRPGVRLAGRMRAIPGSVPPPGTAVPGERFAPRNTLASPHAAEQEPPVHVLDDGAHMVRTWDPVREWTPELVDRLTGPARSGGSDAHTPSDEVIIDLHKVSKTYLPSRVRLRARAAQSPDSPLPKGGVRAVDEVTLQIRRGELFGLVGETGSGKSTLGKLIMDLERPDAGPGAIDVARVDLAAHRSLARERAFRRDVQMVFQNPQDSLDPRRTISQAIAEPLQALTTLDRRGVRLRIEETLDAVGLPRSSMEKYPSQISGGQRQRIAIARAIATRPSVIVADEPTSALDVSVQGQIINLMLDLQREFDLTYLFITHNLSLITSIADRVGVMYHGKMVEVGTAERILSDPTHEYTRRLLDSNPDPFAAIAA